MWLIKPSCKYKTTANLQKIFEKMLAENVKNHNLFKNGFWYKSKKHPTGLTTGGVLKKICLTKILF